MVKATGSIRANQSVPKLNTSSGWPDGQRALERACYLMASRPKARNQVADFCSAPMAGCYAAVDTMGIHLVIIGPVDHCMLTVEEIDYAGEGFTVRTKQIELLSQVAADNGMLQADLYVDGQLRRGMGQTMIECFGERSDGWFRVVHRDPSLRSLSAQIDAKRF